MADLIIDDDLLRRLREIARKENRPVEDVLRAMVDKYGDRASERARSSVDVSRQPPAWLERQPETPEYDPLEDFLGMFDDEVGNLSSMTKEDVLEAYRKKYADYEIAEEAE